MIQTEFFENYYNSSNAEGALQEGGELHETTNNICR